jgi:hypothetical protein
VIFNILGLVGRLTVSLGRFCALHLQSLLIIRIVIALIASLLLLCQDPFQLQLEAPDGSLGSHDLAVPLAAPLPEGVAFIRYAGASSEPLLSAGPVSVQLLDGGRVNANFLGGAGDFLDLSIIGDVRLRVSVEELSSVVIEERIPLDWSRKLEAAPEGDRIYRVAPRGLERLDGTLEEFTEDGVLFTTRVGQKALAWKEICGLYVESLGDEPDAPPSGTHVIVDLVDGGRVHGGLLEIRSGEMDFVTRSGRGLRLPRSCVKEVFVPDAGAAFLSELEPAVASAEGSPFGDGFGMVWPHRVDRSVTGGLLTAMGQIYTRGIGVHAPSRLEWTLDGSWSALRLGAAVDDEVLSFSSKGSVVFRVIVDGELRFESASTSAGSPVTDVGEITLAGAKSLVLEVDMDRDLHVADRADWLRPVLFGRDD